MRSLLTQAAGRIRASEHWFKAKDGDPVARALFQRHYSRYVYADGRQPKKFIGPGQYTLLIDADGTAIFAWRRFISADGQQGINCCIFRNESRVLSSELIKEAERIAAERWPGQRFYTYVNPRAVRSTNAGFCFKQAGWRICGVTKRRALLILEKLPQ